MCGKINNTDNILIVRDNLIQVKVTPKASKKYVKIIVDNNKKQVLKLYVTQPSHNNKANKAVIHLLATTLNIPKSSLIILHCSKSKDKLIKILN